MLKRLLHVTPSGAAGLAFAAFAFLVIPALAGKLWLSVFISTGCFVLAIAGVAFMYARLGMVSLTQVGLMGVGGWVMLRLNHAAGFPFEVNLVIAALVTMVCGWILALPAMRMRGPDLRKLPSSRWVTPRSRAICAGESARSR